jgi:hypothetical protein
MTGTFDHGAYSPLGTHSNLELAFDTGNTQVRFPL